MKTMRRTSTATLVVSSTITGLAVSALTAVTNTGAGGAYAFMFVGLLVLSIFLLWPDVRERFSNGPPSRPRQRDTQRP